MGSASERRKKSRYSGDGRDRFARMLVDRIRQAGEKRQISYDCGAFALSAGESHKYFLERPYRLYQEAPWQQREARVRDLVRVWFFDLGNVPEAFADARGDLLPVLRGVSCDKEAMTRPAAQGEHWPFRPFPGYMRVGVVYDFPEGMAHVEQTMLARWKVSFDEALDAAKDNLRSRSRKPLEKVGPGVWRSQWCDQYDSSRLLLPELLERYDVAGDLVAMAPALDVLLLTGTEEPLGLALLACIGETFGDDPRALCPVALRRDGDSWLPYQPPAGHPAHWPLGVLGALWLARQYNSQMRDLNEAAQQRGEKGGAARAHVLLDGGEYQTDSLCDWVEGEELLLPRTDRVRFFRGKEILGEARWDRVQEVMGDALEPQGLCLERYRVRCFPSAGQLRQMCG